MPTATAEATSKPKHTRSRGRPTHQRQVSLAGAALTQGKVNAVWAAFKAGVAPARIARQFGFSLSQVQRALSSEPLQR
jgi:hypothetical protein